MITPFQGFDSRVVWDFVGFAPSGLELVFDVIFCWLTVAYRFGYQLIQILPTPQIKYRYCYGRRISISISISISILVVPDKPVFLISIRSYLYLLLLPTNEPNSTPHERLIRSMFVLRTLLRRNPNRIRPTRQ